MYLASCSKIIAQLFPNYWGTFSIVNELGEFILTILIVFPSIFIVNGLFADVVFNGIS